MCVAREFWSTHSMRTSSVEFQELEMLWETGFQKVLHLTCNCPCTNHFIKNQNVPKASWSLKSIYGRKCKL